MIPVKSLTTIYHNLKFDKNTKISLSIWLFITILTTVQSLVTHRYNNYLIFENTFRNLINQNSFYAIYPEYHFDANHYGPIFSVFFMPFALLPNAVGLILWNFFTTILLFYAIQTLPLKNKTTIYLIAIACLTSSLLSEQSNPIIVAFIILSYTKLNSKKGLWSTMFIILGTFIKLYGTVGLAFFFFVKDKKRFIIYLLLWSIVFFALPMLFSSPTFIINSYSDWATSLSHKNMSNILVNTIDISIMGFTRHLLNNPEISNLVFLAIGIIIFFTPYFNMSKFANHKFQLLILASTLMFTVLFSTGSEDCTYIIAIPGVGIWYLLTEKRPWKSYLLALVILFSCNLPQFLFHSLSSKNPILLTMLSVPFFLVWLFTIANAYNLNTDGSHK